MTELKLNSNDLTCSRALENMTDFKYNYEIWLHKLLPYYNEVKNEASDNLILIITSVGRAIILQKLNDILYWTRQLHRFIRLNGLHFSKEQHVLLAQIYFSLVTTADLNLCLVDSFGRTLSLLLSKRRILSRHDLSLPWRPLYEIYLKTVWKDIERDGLFILPEKFKSNLNGLIEKCRNYFPLQATEEILQEVRQYMYPWGKIFTKVMTILDVFLPTSLTAEEHLKYGANLWFSDIWYWFAEQWNEPPFTFETLRIFSSLATESPNYIDWSRGDYCDIIFTAILRNLQLPVVMGNQQTTTGNDQFFPFYSTGCLIAQMLGDRNNQTQKCLSKLTNICQSYLNPLNCGPPIDKCAENLTNFLEDLVNSVCHRVHKEKYCQKTDWIEKRPSQSQLTEKQIETFVQSVLPCIEMGVYRESNSDVALKAMKSLARLAPNLVLPVIMKNMEQAMESVTEPQRFVPSIQCFSDSVIMIIRDKGNLGKLGIRCQLFSLIQSLIPFINYNDQRGHEKSLEILKAFHLIFTIVPLVNYSKFEVENEEEKLLSLQSCQIPELITELVLEKLFGIIFNIEASYLGQLVYDEKIQPELDHNDMVDLDFCLAVEKLFFDLTSNSDEEIFMLVAEKTEHFIRQNTFTSKWAIIAAADMLNSIIICHSKFLPPYFEFVLDKIKENVTEDINTVDQVSSDLLWYIRLASGLLLTRGNIILANREKILKLLYLISPIKHIQLRDDICNIFGYVLSPLCSTFLRVIPKKETHTNEHMFTQWAKPFDREDDQLLWEVPTDEKLDFTKEILDEFFRPHLEALREPKRLSKHDVETSLKFLISCIKGMSESLPCLPGNRQKWKNSASAASISCCSAAPSTPELNWPNGDNIRLIVFQVVHPLINFLLENRPDETKNLVLTCEIYRLLMFYWGTYKEDYDYYEQGGSDKFQNILNDNVQGTKMDVKFIIRWKGYKEHKLRLLKRGDVVHCTEKHLEIMKDLLKLSMNTYRMVRISAQKVFDQFYQTFWNCYHLFIDDLMAALGGNQQDKEKLVGALYLLAENENHLCMGAAQDWSTINRIWLDLLQMDPSSFQSPSYHVGFRPEKSTVVSMIDNLMTALKADFYSFPVHFELRENTACLAKGLWKSVPQSCEVSLPTEQDVETAKIQLACENKERLSSYYQLNETILTELSRKLHWRFELIGNKFLKMLTRYDIEVGESVVLHFLQLLIDESAQLRGVAVQVINTWLKMNKPKAAKCKLMVPSGLYQFDTCVLTDNHTQFMYQKRKLPATPDEWDNTLFMDKLWLIFWNWPQNISINGPAVMQIDRNRGHNSLSSIETEFVKHFSDPDFVKKIIDLTVLHGEFDGLGQMFKLLFCTYNDMFLPTFITFVEELSKDDKHEKQALVALIIYGVLSGSKLWKYEKVKKLKEWLTLFMNTFFQRLDEDKICLWTPLMELLTIQQDHRRFSWLFEMLFQLSRQNASFSYQNAGLLKLLCNLISGSWHASELNRELFDIITKKMAFTQDSKSHIVAECLQNVVQSSGTKTKLSDKNLNPLNVDFVLKMFFHKFMRDNVESDVVPSNNNEENNFQVYFLRLCFHYLIDYFNDSHSVISKNDLTLKRKVKIKRNSVNYSTQERTNIYRVFLDFLLKHFGRNYAIIPPSLFKLLPIILCPDFVDDSDLKDRFDSVLWAFAQSRICKNDIPAFLNTCEQIIEIENFKVKVSLLNLLNVFVLTNYYAFSSNSINIERLEKITHVSLCNSRYEVRTAAHETLTGLLMSRIIVVHSALIEKFINWTNNTDDLTIGHGGVLGLLSIVRAFPYTLPQFLPNIFIQLANNSGAPSPIQECIKKGIRTFRETHQECWNEHKRHFTENQLQIYSDISGASNHYV